MRYGVKVFAALITVLVTILAIVQGVGITCDVRLMLALIGLITLIAICAIFVKCHVNHLPDCIVIDGDRDGRYVLAYETREICKRFNQETTKYFGRDCVDDLLVESWRVKIPEAFIYIENEHREPCAALCIFGLKQSFMEQFIKGRVSEGDIDKDDVLDLSGSKKSDSLYLPVIIVDQPHTPLGHRRALVMVWGAIQYLKKVYGLRRLRTLYAVPVNGASENLLKRFGFQLKSPACTRKDRHDLYALDISKDSVSQALERIGDYSTMCAVRI